MLPYYLQIGEIKLPSYGLMIAIGIVTGVFLMSKNAAFRLNKLYPGNDPAKIDSRLPKAENMLDFTLIAIVFGAIGGKLLYLLPNLSELTETGFMEILTNGFVIYGSVIGGAFGGFLYCRKKKLDTISCFDTALPFVSLAQAFGRMGCFLAGCCYGRPSSSAISVVFKSEYSLAPTNVPLVPTQLISSAGNLLIFVILLILSRKVMIRGIIFASYMILYSTGRFIVEFYRGDSVRGFIGRFSTSQFISIFVLAAGVITMGIVLIKKRNHYSEIDNVYRESRGKKG